MFKQPASCWSALCQPWHHFS